MPFVMRCDGGCTAESTEAKGWMRMQTAPYPYGFGKNNGHIPLELSKLRLDLIFCPKCWQGITSRMYLPAKELRMRFTLGELYQGDGPDGPLFASVVEISDEGRSGKLRFHDDGRELDFNWQQLHQMGLWHRVAAQTP